MSHHLRQISEELPRCETCIHFRRRNGADTKVEAGHEGDRYWCNKNDFPTTKYQLRCGGDDFTKKPL